VKKEKIKRVNREAYNLFEIKRLFVNYLKRKRRTKKKKKNCKAFRVGRGMDKEV
jgi:hypothetical protein